MPFLCGMSVVFAAFAAPQRLTDIEVVEACLFAADAPWNLKHRAQIASCLGWKDDATHPICKGDYQPMRRFSPRPPGKLVQIRADDVAFVSKGRSKLRGHVEVQQGERAVSAETAYLYRDPETQKVTEIELLGDVVYTEPGRFMRSHRVKLNPDDKSGIIDHTLYRLKHSHAHATLPAFGKADLIQRFKNRDLLLKGATYTTCSPKDNAWMLRANEIHLYESEGKGVARDAVLEFRDQPIVYAPYLTFPISKKRKSGFLMPTSGYSNIGGGDLSFPYYWNIAPNYDATIVPRAYTRRGFMIGGDTRFMTAHSQGVIGGTFLGGDRAFREYLNVHEISYPQLRNLSDNRWSVFFRENTAFTDRLRLEINYQKISDDYFLQDFSNNMTVMTESQLLQEGALTYTGEHWYGRAMAQSYQTLNPINQSPVSYIYQRLPQIQLRGEYNELPWHAKFVVRGQYDLFHWPVDNPSPLEGPRYHVNPVLSFDFRKPWGYITPEVQLVENHYNLHMSNSGYSPKFNHTIPRYDVDAGLTFERPTLWQGERYTQTFEPRVYYMYIPYQNQSDIPAFDSAYMIYRYEQLFRRNRFSGFDRIADANQISYAFRSRLLSDKDGEEKASVSVGQAYAFSPQQVQLCYARDGICTDNSQLLGFTSTTAGVKPLASVLSYTLNPNLLLSASWSFDFFQNATDNADLNITYEPEENHIFRFMYSYLVDANLIRDLNNEVEALTAEHQATLAYAWPFNDHWSSVGIFSYNISERYDMVSFLGIQYESCCWAVRAFAGRAFNSLTLDRDGSQYNNSVYIQLLLKGLGTVSSNDPASTIRTYLPTYKDIFHK